MALDVAWSFLKGAPVPDYARGSKGPQNYNQASSRYSLLDEDQNRDLLAAKRFRAGLKPKTTRTALLEGEDEEAKWDSMNRDSRLSDSFDPDWRMRRAGKHVERMPRPGVGHEESFDTAGYGGPSVFEPTPSWQHTSLATQPLNPQGKDSLSRPVPEASTLASKYLQ